MTSQLTHGLSMRREDAIRVRHMTEAAAKALAFTHGRTRRDLDDDEMLRLAITKLVEIVGEAAKQVSPDVRADHPDVAWRAAARMRDRLTHHYFDINLDVLWQTVTVDLPALIADLPEQSDSE
ncbi:MAG: DUF86 domain-containing protein [Kineosporiaceae bacterium]